MSDLSHGAVAIVGGDVYQNSSASGTVAFEHDFVNPAAFEFTGAAHDGALNVVGGHTDGFGRGNGGTQSRVSVGIATTPGSDLDFFDEARESLAALGIEGRFFVLDCGPLTVSGHAKTSKFLITEDSKAGASQSSARRPADELQIGHLLHGVARSFAAQTAFFDAAVGHVIGTIGGHVVDHHTAELKLSSDAKSLL